MARIAGIPAELKEEKIKPITMRIGFRDPTSPSGTKTLVFQCHWFRAVDGWISLYRVVNGRMTQFACFSAVVSVEEL